MEKPILIYVDEVAFRNRNKSGEANQAFLRTLCYHFQEGTDVTNFSRAKKFQISATYIGKLLKLYNQKTDIKNE